MVSLLPCPLPFSNSSETQSISTVDSSSSSSLDSQSSLQSVPSLSLPSFEHAAAAAADYHCLATLKGHTSSIFSLAIAGKHLYSGASGGEFRVWDRHPNSSSNSVDYSMNMLVADGHDLSAVKSIVVLGEKIFTAHNDHKIRVWKIDSAAEPQKHRLVATLPTMGDRCARLFSAKNYVKVRRHKTSTWVHHVDAVSALALSKDGAALYSASWDRSLKVWQTSNFHCLESIQNAHDDAINAVIVSVDGTVYTGSADRKIKVWRRNPNDTEKNTKNKYSLISTLEKHKSTVNALALSPDNTILYSGACDRSIIVWEKNGGSSHMSVAGALRGHTRAILCLAVVGDLLCSGSADGTVRMWRRGMGVGNYACLGVIEGHGSPVKCLAAGLDSKHVKTSASDGRGEAYLVYSGSLDKEIKVWKVWVPDSR